MLEEDTRANLHDALASFTLHSAESLIIYVVINQAKIGMVEDVLRLETKLKVARSFGGKREFFQQRQVGEDTARIPYIAEYKRRVGQAKVRSFYECVWIQNQAGLVIRRIRIKCNEASPSSHKRLVIVAGLKELSAGRD